MTILRVGTTKKYAENWQQVFGGRKGKSAATAEQKSTVKKKATAKSNKAKGSGKKSSKR